MLLDADTLIEQGTHKVCPGCNGALIRASVPACTECRRRGRGVAAAPVRRPRTAPTQAAASRVTTAALGGLATLPGKDLWLVVEGEPVTQGSMRAIAAGVIRHEKGPKLRAWRDRITREALRLGGDRWEPIDGPVCVHVTLTVPAPKRINLTGVEALDTGSTPRCPPLRKPDADKLLRAVQDALSPRDDKKPGETVKRVARRFKLLVDDARVVDSFVSKTYPRPLHTHPWALPWPGAVIHVSPVGSGHTMPSSSLAADPGPFPHAAERALAEVSARCA